MSINAVNGMFGANAYLNISKIPEYLKSQMEELGIDPAKASNGNEARKLIQERQENPQTQQTEDAGENKSKPNSLLDRVLSLAAKLGIVFDKGESIEEMLSQLQSLIQNLSVQAAKRGNMSLVNFLKDCQFELDSIMTSMKGADTSNTQVYNYLEMLAEQNKQSHKLSND